MPIDNICRGRWIVVIKGDYDHPHFEIAVTRDDNKHGIECHGWFNDNKYLITYNDNSGTWTMLSLVWNKQIKLAKEVAEELNYRDFGIKGEAIVINMKDNSFSLNFDKK